MTTFKKPSDEVFDEVKQKSIEVWKENHSDEFGYVTEKVNSIKDVENVGDNILFIVSKFDTTNKARLFLKLNHEARKYLVTR